MRTSKLCIEAMYHMLSSIYVPKVKKLKTIVHFRNTDTNE